MSRDPAAIGPDGGRRRHLVIVLPNTGAHDSRTYRLARDMAARGHRVTVLARAGGAESGPSALASLPGVELVAVAIDRAALLPGPLRRPARIAGRVAGRLLPREFARLLGVVLDVAGQGRAAESAVGPADVWHAMGMLALPVALRLRRRFGGKVVYDSLEVYIAARNLARLPGAVRGPVARWERARAREADALLTVNEPCRRVLRRRFGRDPGVVYNCPDAPQLPVAPGRRFHDLLGLDAGTLVVLYHGGISAGRGIEQLITAIGRVDGAVLVVMGYGELEGALRPLVSDRVRLLPAVPPPELLDWVASADIVAVPIQPTTLNHRLSTPNKLFEAMAVGRPVLASDMPGMRAIVRAAGCGVLVDARDPAAIAAGLGELVSAPAEVREAMGRRGRDAVRERYGWTRSLNTVVRVYAGLSGDPW